MKVAAVLVAAAPVPDRVPVPVPDRVDVGMGRTGPA